MGFYKNFIFPRMVNWGLGDEKIGALRKDLLNEVKGEVLEIGFGTGLNLPFYPPTVAQLSVVDPNPGMHKLAARKAKNFHVPIEHHLLEGEKLPFSEGSFDTVVATFTLCSIPNVNQALKEVRRVLKKGGKFYFLEHGLSEEPKIQRWQNRLTPINKIIAEGCHLNRKIDWLIKEAGLKIVKLRKFYFEKYPKIVGCFYSGWAEK
jgi:ubiquinone/menaquinone biosynthesis C-methylase UbiE